MATNVVTINKEASIQEALTLMKQGSIRHLPVVDAEKTLIGWVTDADLRGVLIASMLEELSLEDVMVRKPVKTHPDAPIEEAARLLLERKIGGLPVLEGGKLVGVLTVVDVLSAFITILGMLGNSTRLDVKMTAGADQLDEITRLVHDHQAEVISICHLPVSEGKESVYSFRLKKCDVAPLVTALKKQGFDVAS